MSSVEPGDRYGPSMAVPQGYVVPISGHLLFPTAGVTHHLLAVRTGFGCRRKRALPGTEIAVVQDVPRSSQRSSG